MVLPELEVEECVNKDLEQLPTGMACLQQIVLLHFPLLYAVPRGDLD